MYCKEQKATRKMVADLLIWFTHGLWTYWWSYPHYSKKAPYERSGNLEVNLWSWEPFYVMDYKVRPTLTKGIPNSSIKNIGLGKIGLKNIGEKNTGMKIYGRGNRVRDGERLLRILIAWRTPPSTCRAYPPSVADNLTAYLYSITKLNIMCM